MSLYESVQQNLKEVFSHLQDDYDENLLQPLLHPQKIIEVSIPVQMDDGSTKIFIGYRSQHNNNRGPYKWWIRFHQSVTKDEVMSLSAWMTMKTAVVDIPLGWWKWWVIVNPKELSKNELKQLSQWYMKAIAHDIGADVDVPAPDVNTNAQIMARMLDAYTQVTGKSTPGVVTGKPLSLGGSAGRDIATSLWWLYVLQEYFDYHNDNLEWKKIAIQWSGNAGMNFAKLAVKHGAKVIALSDSSGGVYHEDGLDIKRAQEYKQEWNKFVDFKDGQFISNEELLLLDVDVLVPAALENQITMDNASQVRAKIILELANGPIALNANDVLNDKWVVVIPDVLANAGGVTVSYFEQVQNNMNYYRSEEEVFEKLEKIIKPATEKVITTAEQYSTSLRTWAYIVALKRILDVSKITK